MKQIKKSIYEIIKENLVDGTLPKTFSLPSDQSEHELCFADGAMDGIAIYHMMGHSEVSAESMSKLETLLHNISDGNFALGLEILCKFAKESSALNTINELEGFIYDNTDWINPNHLHQFAIDCMMGNDRELIKFGMEMIEVFTEPDEKIKEIIRTLGLSDEFTIFAIFNMQHWSNANSEIFHLAKNVHGWGRIHAVKYLEPTSKEIKDWLLKEGIKNNVMDSYSALEVYKKANIRELLNRELTDEEFHSITSIISALLSEGPVQGISAVEDADAMLLDFLNQTKQHELYLDLCNTIYHILYNEYSDSVITLCKNILHSDKAEKVIIDSLHKGQGVDLAKYLNMDYAEPLYQHMIENFENGWHNCRYLLKNSDYREKVLNLFKTKLPMEEMVSDPKDNRGLGKGYENYTKLLYVIQELKPYPLCGIDFVMLGLKSPVINNRNMALQVLNSWCKIKECSLKELSDKLYHCVSDLKDKEVSESVQKRIAEYEF